MALMEQPLLIGFVGLTIVTVLVGSLIQTGKKPLLYASIAVLLLTVGLLALERATVTPREHVKATLHVIAGDLERNDVMAVVDHVSKDREELRREAERVLKLIEIEDVNIKKNLKVQLYEERGIQYAEARFNAVIRATVKRSEDYGTRPYPQFFVVRFRNEDGKWRVRDYERDDPRAGIGG